MATAFSEPHPSPRANTASELISQVECFPQKVLLNPFRAHGWHRLVAVLAEVHEWLLPILQRWNDIRNSMPLKAAAIPELFSTLNKKLVGEEHVKPIPSTINVGGVEVEIGPSTKCVYCRGSRG